uniref:GDSL-type esterase/lipase family protein n=1 Tax=Agathobacter sp. TaxID=2021311 RepID=UPI004055D0B8
MKKIHIKRWLMAAVLALLMAAGYGYLYWNGLSGVHPENSTEEGKIKVACVGDSITYGLGITSWPENNYPAVLDRLLGTDYQVANFGESGRSVQETADRPYIKEDSYENSLSYDPDILIFMMGTNDTKPYNWKGKDAFIAAYEKVLESYMETDAPPQLYICTPATAFYIDGKAEGEAEFDIQPHIVEEVAQLIREFAKVYEGETALIDVNLMTKEHPEWFEKDGIHPNNDGAKNIAEYIAAAIK